MNVMKWFTDFYCEIFWLQFSHFFRIFLGSKLFRFFLQNIPIMNNNFLTFSFPKLRVSQTKRGTTCVFWIIWIWMKRISILVVMVIYIYTLQHYILYNAEVCNTHFSINIDIHTVYVYVTEKVTSRTVDWSPPDDPI